MAPLAPAPLATTFPWLVAIFVMAWLCSAMYHTMRAHSLPTFNCTLICDLSGIVLDLAVCNYMVIVFALDRCGFEAWGQIYHYANTFGFIANIVLIPLLMRCGASSFRTCCWVAYAGISLLVHVHREQLGAARDFDGLRALFLTYSLAVVSLIIRNLKIPERFAHGTYDLIGASHGIFHFTISLAPIPLFTHCVEEFINNTK